VLKDLYVVLENWMYWLPNTRVVHPVIVLQLFRIHLLLHLQHLVLQLVNADLLVATPFALQAIVVLNTVGVV
jgi:hypothetical protein